MMAPQLDEGYILFRASKHMLSKINNPATASPNDTWYFFARLAQADQSSLEVEWSHANHASKNWAVASPSSYRSQLHGLEEHFFNRCELLISPPAVARTMYCERPAGCDINIFQQFLRSASSRNARKTPSFRCCSTSSRRRSSPLDALEPRWQCGSPAPNSLLRRGERETPVPNNSVWTRSGTFGAEIGSVNGHVSSVCT